MRRALSAYFPCGASQERAEKAARAEGLDAEGALLKRRRLEGAGGQGADRQPAKPAYDMAAPRI